MQGYWRRRLGVCLYVNVARTTRLTLTSNAAELYIYLLCTYPPHYPTQRQHNISLPCRRRCATISSNFTSRPRQQTFILKVASTTNLLVFGILSAALNICIIHRIRGQLHPFIQTEYRGGWNIVGPTSQPHPAIEYLLLRVERAYP